MELIPASRFSIDQLAEAYNQTRVDYLVPMPMTPRRLQEYVDVYGVNLDSSSVAVEGEQILGLCMLGLRDNRAWITRLGVLPTTRRHGTGRALTEACLDEAARQGCALAQLEVIIGNTPAHTLFLRLGFREIRKLLVLRRPPGPPPADPIPPSANLTWLGADEVLQYAAVCPWRPAWTNTVESLANAGALEGLHLSEYNSQLSGWVSFERGKLQMTRVIASPDEASEAAPTYTLLYHLHSRFPTLDTIAENVPTHVPHLEAFWAHGYIQSFARIEMELDLTTL